MLLYEFEMLQYIEHKAEVEVRHCRGSPSVTAILRAKQSLCRRKASLISRLTIMELSMCALIIKVDML
jgi:hypothetical protein